MNRKAHWENVYTTRRATEVGWYRPRLELSLEWIGDLGLPVDAPIIDVGGGASTLVDDLLDAGYGAVSVLDISEAALIAAKERQGETAGRVTWIPGDVTAVELPSAGYELWHDRAVFHFLTDAEDQRRYRAALLESLRPGGRLIIGTFAPDAPPRCSGLPVQRYDKDLLARTLGPEFELERDDQQLHVTPGGVEQMYLYCQFRRRGRTSTTS